MKARKFILLLLVFCLVFALSSTSMAAKKKRAKGSASSGDAVAQILKKYKPANKTNAQMIRNAIAKYKRNQIMILTWDESGGTYDFELVSSKNGARIVKASAFLGNTSTNMLSLWNKMEKGYILEFTTGIRFYYSNGDLDFNFIDPDEFSGRTLYDALDKLEDKGNLFPEERIPYILQYINDGV